MKENLAIFKTARYKIWEPTQVIIDKNAEISNIPKITYKLKTMEKWKGVHFLNILEANASCLVSLSSKLQVLKFINNITAKQITMQKSKTENFCSNLALQAIPQATALSPTFFTRD